jgi:hypothetical protein
MRQFTTEKPRAPAKSLHECFSLFINVKTVQEPVRKRGDVSDAMPMNASPENKA